MPRSTKTTAEKLTNVEEQIKQLENQKKLLLQQQKTQDRKARDHRLCKRGAYLEKIIPDTIPFTDEQFYQFLDKTLTGDYARRALEGIKAKTAQGTNGRNGAGTSMNTQGKAG